MPPVDEAERVLEVRDLRVSFKTSNGVVNSVNGVDLDCYSHETLAIVGESGSGKSVTARAMMGMVTDSNAVVSGSIRLGQSDLLTMSEKQLRQVRGRHISLVSQDVSGALNPVMTVGNQIAEMYAAHEGVSWKTGRLLARDLMDRLAIPMASQRLNDYPHQFSGGMSQRVLIAMAIALNPRVLIADEPTTALDVTVQAQILELLAGIQRETGMSLILITHDAGVVAEVSDHVAVMYAGSVMEVGPTGAVYEDPHHPYMAGLLESMPHIESANTALKPIVGTPPDPIAVPAGCPFHPRCPRAESLCSTDEPQLRLVSERRASACHFSPEQGEPRGEPR